MLSTRKWFTALGLLVILSMMLAACQPAPTPAPGEPGEPTPIPEPTPAPEKTLVVCAGQEPDTLYIYGGAMLAAAHIQEAIYGVIDGVSFDYQPVIFEKLPSLADGDAAINAVTVKEGDKVVDENGEPGELVVGMRIRPAGCRADDCEIEYAGGEVQMDQMVATFTLVDGLTWEDGTPVTARDSVYSFELQLDPDTPAPSKFIAERTASYVDTDDRTLVWTGLPGWIDATYFINAWTPLPEHELGGMTAAEIVESEEASRTPMAFGPFMIQEWVPGDHLTLVKNPYYFRAAEGLPKVDKIIFRYTIVEQPNTAIAALVAGECDIIDQTMHLDDQSELLIEMEKAGVLVPTFVTGTVWEHGDFGINPVADYVRPDFFEDVRVRQAIAHCIDRQALVDAVTFGKSVVIHSYIPEIHPLYNPDVVKYEYDVERGKALLEEVGWIDADGDGVREATGVSGVADGTKLAFKWQSTVAEIRVKYMQILKEQLAQCGIDLTIENMPASQWFADGPDGPLFGRRFDMGSFAWLTGVEPPCNLYLSSEIPGPENGWSGQNNPGFSDPEYDRVCQAALSSLKGEPGYEQYHKEAQLLFSQKLPVIPLFLRTKLAAYRPEVTGFIMDPTANSEFWNVENFGIR